jgi:RNA-binding protein
MRGKPSSLNGRQARHLRALAHHLDPVVAVGKEGVTDAVVRAAWQALADHELIKVKLPQVDKAERREMTQHLRRALEAHVVDEVGRVAILYRRRPDKPKITLPG